MLVVAVAQAAATTSAERLVVPVQVRVELYMAELEAQVLLGLLGLVFQVWYLLQSLEAVPLGVRTLTSLVAHHQLP
jgi:hypothetical protein